MLQKFDFKPGTGIAAATILILLVSGARLANQWGELSIWREPGLFVALGLAVAAVIVLAVGYARRRRPLQEVDFNAVRGGPVIDGQVDSKAASSAEGPR